MKQLSLLNNLILESKDVNIPGLKYIPNYITEDAGKLLVETIDQQKWLTDLKRRVQHYGFKYDYKTSSINNNNYLGPLPDWFSSLSSRLYEERIFQKLPNQVIINEYLPGQGIAPHIDSTLHFGDIIASLSLGSSSVMRFSNLETSQHEEILLERNSLVVLSQDARYKWQHSIPARKTDKYNNVKYIRDRRISITFREYKNL